MTISLNQFYAEQILNFICKYAPYIIQKAKKLPGNTKQTLRTIILKHIEFQTVVCVWSGSELIGVCNFNLHNNVVDVLDCVVRTDFRFKNVLKQMVLIALHRWPSIEILKFSREKEGNRKPHQILVSRFIK